MKNALKAVTKTVTPTIASIPGAGTVELLKVADIQVDPSYQRDSIKSHYKDIANNWHWKLYSVINVARRPDGSLYCYDGGNRVTAAQLAGVKELLCYVVPTSGAEEEAELFVGINSKRRRIKPIEKFNAMSRTGADENVFVEDLLKQYGIEITTAAKCGVGKTTAVNTIMNHLNGSVDKRGKDIVDCIEILLAAWPTSPQALSGRVVEAMLRVLIRISEDSRKILLKNAAKNLGRYDLDALMKAINAEAKSYNAPVLKFLPTALIDKFNHGVKKYRIA